MSRNLLSLCAVVLAMVAGGCQSPSGAPKTDKKTGMTWYTRAYPTGQKSTSAVLLEYGTPAQIPIRQPYDYEIRVTNLTNQPIEEVGVTEWVSPSCKINSAKPDASSKTDQQVLWKLGTMAPHATTVISVNATNSSTGEATSRCEVTYRAPLITSVQVVEPKLSLKRQAPSNVIAGDPIPVEYHVSNPGTGTATGIVIEEKLPEGVLASDGGNEVRIEIPSLGAGQTKVERAQLQAAKTGEYKFHAVATAAGGLSSDSGESQVKVTRPVLALAGQAPQEWALNHEMEYRFKVENKGDGVAKEGLLKVELPIGVHVVDGNVTAMPTAKGTETIQFSLKDVKPGDSQEISFRVIPKKPGDLQCSATAHAHGSEEAKTTILTKVKGMASLSLAVEDATDPIAVGGEEVYQITVTNAGSAPSTHLNLVCHLDKAMTFVSADGATTGALKDATIVFKPLDQLLPGQKAVWRVRATAKSPGDIRFSASLKSDDQTVPLEQSESTKALR